jgi:hypothetical protein
MTDQEDETTSNSGRDPKTGVFLKGNKIGKGSVKGSRSRLTMKLLERFEERNQDGVSIEELMFDIAQGTQYDADLRMKAAAKLADLVFPKTAQVELEVDDTATASVAEMDERIKQIIDQIGEEETRG